MRAGDVARGSLRSGPSMRTATWRCVLGVVRGASRAGRGDRLACTHFMTWERTQVAAVAQPRIPLGLCTRDIWRSVRGRGADRRALDVDIAARSDLGADDLGAREPARRLHQLATDVLGVVALGVVALGVVALGTSRLVVLGTSALVRGANAARRGAFEALIERAAPRRE